MISVCFQGKPFNITVIQAYALTSNAEEAEVEQFYEDLQDLLELTPQKRCPFHHRGLECKSRKSRNTWSNRQVWPWSTEWSRTKATRVLSKECTGHSKHPLPTTQEKTLHVDITRGQHTQLCPTLCESMDCSTPGLPVHHQLPELVQIHVHWVSDAIQPYHSLLSPSPPTFNLSQHQGLLHGAVLHIRWPKYWSFSFNISPSNEYSGIISFRMDWLALLAVQVTLKSLLEHHSSKASILQCSAFFIVQLSHPYMPTGKPSLAK